MALEQQRQSLDILYCRQGISEIAVISTYVANLFIDELDVSENSGFSPQIIHF